MISKSVQPSFAVKYQRELWRISRSFLLTLLVSLVGGYITWVTSLRVGAHAEERPQASGYLPVEELPPPRSKPMMTPDERAKLKKDLATVHDRQAVVKTTKSERKH